MNAKDYVSQLSQIMNFPLGILKDTSNEKEGTRPLFVTLSRANYGAVDSAIIEFQGSPPRCSVFISGLQYSPMCRSIMVHGKTLRPMSKKHSAAVKLVSDFLAVWCAEHNETLSQVGTGI